MSAFPTLAEIVNGHHWYRPARHDKPWITRCVGCNWIGDTRNTGKSATGLHAEHVQAEWLKACTITTVEQLDSLPDGSVVHVPHKPSASSVEGRYGQWWPNRSEGPYPYDRRNELLPARLIHHPEWSAS
ncbi:hypothetical protein [Mycolicibacterium setense]